MLDPWIEDDGLLDVSQEYGVGTIVYSPLAQGLLTNKYLKSIPEDSRAASSSVFLKPEQITKEMQKRLISLNELATSRNQSLAQLALSWVLKDQRITSALIGASKVSQIEDSVQAINHIEFTQEELQSIQTILQ